MNIDQANIANLKSLWKEYGSKTHSINSEIATVSKTKLHYSINWPHRCWVNDPTALNDYLTLKYAPESSIFPVWPVLHNEQSTEQIIAEQLQVEKELKNNNWYCILEQKAMTLSLANSSSGTTIDQIQPHPHFTIHKVKTTRDMSVWINIASKAFGYPIDHLVIERLLNKQDIKLLIARDSGQAAASALLYKTDDIIGIHQVGVKPNFQGKGLARHFMQKIINICQLWQANNIVLQASAAGKPLYESLGFTEQFSIKNYKKIES